VGGGTALEAEGVREELHAFRRRARLGLAASALALVLFVVLVDVTEPRRRHDGGDDPPAMVLGLSVLVAGGILGVAGCGSLVLRARRQARVLASNAWTRTPCRYGEVRPRWALGFGNPQPLVLLEDASGRGTVVGLTSVLISTLARSGISDATELDVAGPPAGHCVLRGPASGHLFSARPPRTAREEHRWRGVFEG
jgi:hypothetical protein